MKSIIGFSLRNKLAIWFLTIVVAAAGAYAGLTMKQETIPNINVPFLNITAVDPGAAPETVMNELTVPLEQMLRNVDGVKNVTSSSMENAASVAVEFDYGANLDEATAQIREGLNRITLPDGVERPQITRFSLNSFPVISLSATAEEGGDDLEKLSRVAQEQVVPELEKIAGVASVQLSGQYVREVQLKFDQKKMAELGLTQETVQNIVNASAVRAPLGLFTLDDSQSAVVVDGGVTTLDNLKALEIPVTPASAQPQAGSSGNAGGAGNAGSAGAAQGQAPGAPAQGAAGAGEASGPDAALEGEAQQGAGAAMTGAGEASANAALEGEAQQGAAAAAAAGLPTVKLSEIAQIDVVGSSESVSRTNGRESIGVQIVKTNDANTVDVVNAVKDRIADLEGQYSGLKLTVMLDQGKPIEDSVRTMLEKAAFGALFAVLIILLFLRDIRSTIISILSIPLSLLIALLLLKQIGVTLNMMTLGAMTVAIGRVVDDSIVVIENIYRRMTLGSEKLRGRQLISAATREMFLPIMSSTIVTLAVFVPLAFVSGMVGELFMPFALTMVFALLASLLIAITLVPMLAHTLFRGGIKKKQTHDKPSRMAAGYKRILNWSLSHKLITFLIAVVLLVGSLFTLPYVGTSFLPSQEDKTFTFTYAPEAGATDEQAQDRMLEAEKYVRSLPHLTNMQYSIGGANPLGFGTSKSALFYTEFESDTPNFDQVKEDLIEGLKKRVPKGEWSQMNIGGGGGLGGSQLSVSVYGDSTDDLKPVADDILKLIQDDPNFEKAESNLEEGYAQYTLVADQQKLSSYGLTAGQIAMTLAPVTQRPVLTKVDLDGQQYNVYIEADSKTFKTLSDIENTKLTSPLGIQVPIRDVVKVQDGVAPETITRSDGKTVAQLSADIVASDVGGASTALEDKIKAMDLPDGITVQFGGVTEQINDTFSQLGLAMLAAIAIVYFVLVVTFGGGLAPFAILFSLPFIVIGALIGLLIGGETLNVSALMGVLMLIGIVVTNAIVLIDRVIHKEREGMSTREALLEAGSTRLRPILMTALATIGALIPLVAGWEGGAGIISKGLGITVIGGLISSTLLTLVIVPVVYEFLMKISSKSRARRAELEKLETPLE